MPGMALVATLDVSTVVMPDMSRVAQAPDMAPLALTVQEIDQTGAPWAG
jgi:hypothetical protein